MGRTATEYALKRMNQVIGDDVVHKTLVLGSIHELPIDYDKIMDWNTPAGDNANFMFEEINSGDWNLIINCCCEHMYPMSEVKLKGIYVLQSNNYDPGGHIHINRCSSIQEHLDQIKLDLVYYAETTIINETEYYTVIGEKN
jgi:hypothetical protein